MKSMRFGKYILFVLFVFAIRYAGAQTIPNNGFESWTNDGTFETPLHWVTNDMLTHKFNKRYDGHTVTKTDQSHSGKYAVKLSVTVNNNDTINGGLYSTGSIDSLLKIYFKKWCAGFKWTTRVSDFKGYYIFNSVKGDTAIFGLDLTKWNTKSHKRDTLINTTMKIGKDADRYTVFDMPLVYKINTEAPDTAFITIGIKGPGKSVAHPGTMLIIDDFQFWGTSAIKK
jgi:hypothetical protein